MNKFPCQYCQGTVSEKVVEREAISHHRGIVILENVPIGICDQCGAHYFAAPVFKRAEDVLKSPATSAKTIEIRVAPYAA